MLSIYALNQVRWHLAQRAKPDQLVQLRLRIHIDLRQILSQISALVLTEYSKRQTDDGPQVNRVVIASVMLLHIMDLGMAVVARSDAIVGPGAIDLLELSLSVMTARFGETGLQKSAAAAATVIVGAVGGHFDEIFFTDAGFQHKPKILCDGIAQ